MHQCFLETVFILVRVPRYRGDLLRLRRLASKFKNSHSFKQLIRGVHRGHTLEIWAERDLKFCKVKNVREDSD